MEEGSYELRTIGLGVDCEEDETSNVDSFDDRDWTLELFPNPGQDRLTIRSSSGGKDVAPIARVFNADGRLVMDLSEQFQGIQGDWQVDASSWTAGMYIIRISQNGQTRQLPWIKLR
ncbi:T9SS type A sorting domain-containing protein [Flavobacteriales bacterium]|nr:T9SS type A sorting domain-containing protein [Flavobacteriales bacterium]